jgi:Flp pilus assembly protein TadG
MITSRDKRTTHRPRRARDDGYVLVLTALLLLPLLAFTGFAVDLGSWYGRAAQVQRASDAAALAGVQDLPNLPKAILTAKSIAAQNGFTDGVGGITVTVAQVPDPTAKLKVTIRDSAASQFFTKAFKSAVLIERTGTAQYLKPVSMGSPRNYLGTGSVAPAPGVPLENYWLAVSGGCASKEQGDRIQAQTDANFNFPSPSFRCAATPPAPVANPEYDSNGYYYAVEMKQSSPGMTLNVEIYDAGYCTGGPTNDSSGAFTTTFQMRDNTSFDPTQTGTLGAPLAAGSGLGCGGWTTLRTINSPTKGVYFVQVTSQTGGSTQDGSNAFSIRARYSSPFQACAGDSLEVPGGGVFRADCPNVYGYGNLGVFANQPSNAAQFYLAQIGPDYNNKQMELSLWDPGEGSEALQVLDPNNNPVDFQWQVMCYNGNAAVGGACGDGTVAPTGGWSGVSTNLTISGGRSVPKGIDTVGLAAGNPQPGTHRLSTSKYSDRLVRLTVQLPADITAAFGGRQWYKIKYWSGATITDRTTWSVSIKGAPIRLIPNP